MLISYLIIVIALSSYVFQSTIFPILTELTMKKMIFLPINGRLTTEFTVNVDFVLYLELGVNDFGYCLVTTHVSRILQAV